MRKLEFVQSICCKVAGSTQTFSMLEYLGEVTAQNSCKYGKYGSFEQFFFLIGHCCDWNRILLHRAPSHAATEAASWKKAL